MQDVIDIGVGALGGFGVDGQGLFDVRKALTVSDFVNHGVVGGREEVGLGFCVVHGLQFLPYAGKALLHHVLGLFAVAEACEREAEKPVGI